MSTEFWVLVGPGVVAIMLLASVSDKLARTVALLESLNLRLSKLERRFIPTDDDDF